MEHAKTMVIKLDDVAVADRIRKENGSLQDLADSIRERGLINPITVMRSAEGNYLLIAGLRRIEACRLLGCADICATVLSPMAADEALMLEIAENEQRKEFTISERLDYAAKIREIEKEKARERKSMHARDGYLTSQDVAKRPLPDIQGRVRDIVAKKAGFTSQQQMSRAAFVADKRPDLLEKIDSGETTICGAFREVKKADDCTSGTETAPFKPNHALLDAPVVSDAKLRRRLTKEDRDAIKHIREMVVTVESVEMEPLTFFNPASIEVSGDPDSVGGAPHDVLMGNPVYAALYEKYSETVRIANATKGELRSRCEGYEKRIRAYEENQQAMRRRIERLEDECAALREAQHAGA